MDYVWGGVCKAANTTASFVRRRWRPLVIAGAVAGGLAYYAQYSENEWEAEAEQLERETTEKMKVHYAETRSTADLTILGLLPDVNDRLHELMPFERITEQLRDKTLSKKRKSELWEELKVLGFARTCAAIYTTAVVTVFVRSQVHILGRHLYLHSMLPHRARAEGDAQQDQAVRLEYLAVVGEFLDTAVPAIAASCQTFVADAVAGWPLKRAVTRADVDGLLARCMEALPADGLTPGRLANAVGANMARSKVAVLVRELKERLSSDDGGAVFTACLSSVFSQLQEHAGVCFQPPGKNGASIPPPRTTDEKDGEPTVVLATLVARFCKLAALPLQEENNVYLETLSHLPLLDKFCVLVYSDFDRVALHEVQDE